MGKQEKEKNKPMKRITFNIYTNTGKIITNSLEEEDFKTLFDNIEHSSYVKLLGENNNRIVIFTNHIVFLEEVCDGN